MVTASILLANKFFYSMGGAEAVFFQERNFLLKKGYKVIDFSMTGEKNTPSLYADFFVPNINYYSNTGMFKNIRKIILFIHSFAAVKNIERLVIQERPDIAHLHNIYHQITPSIIPVLNKYGIKIIMTLHDYKLICPSYLSIKRGDTCTACQGKHFWKAFISNCQNSYMRCLLLSIEAHWHKWKKSYEFVDLFLAPSHFMAELISKRISKNKICILRNGIDCDTINVSPSNKGYALYFGRLSIEKGVKTLINAYQNVKEHLPLKIVGTGPLEEELRKRYPTIDFTGYKTGHELNDLIADAAFVVVPSEWYENCSMAVLESMAFGKPVIGSRIGGIPEQIEDQKTGFLFETGNAFDLTEKMKVFLSKPEIILEMGKAARKKLEQEYSLAEHNKRLIEIYSSVMQN